MKTASGILILLLCSASYAQLRNPFIALSSPCESLLKRLDRQQLRGVFHQPESSMALFGLPAKQWRRVREGQVLEPGVRVLAIAGWRVTASLGGPCEASYYHWSLPGGINDKDRRSTRVGAIAAGGAGK
ncbi:HofP DNA utilization family protein [Cedecea davisae]|uniref:HofP DNA utilization family protein n=1 Tax=Cedecea davisae TaxID=158484 RepID=UPI001D0B5C0F|nr:HofP DNA utilization family protein [Cedecea davisae]